MSANRLSQLKVPKAVAPPDKRYPLACLGTIAVAIFIVWSYGSISQYHHIRVTENSQNEASGPLGGLVAKGHRRSYPSTPGPSPLPLPAWTPRQYGKYPSDHARDDDADAWLDVVGDVPPPIVPSHYASVTGKEPYEHNDTKQFQLHMVPTDDWFDVASRAVSRCDRRLSSDVTGAANGLADKIVWVTAFLFDHRFRRESYVGHGMYPGPYERLQRTLDRGFEMVLYIPADLAKYLMIDTTRIKVIHTNASFLEEYFPYYDRVNSIRTSKLWVEQGVTTGWLSEAPQARIPDYNPLVMSKLMLLKDAARLNPWGARYHMWMDASHLCIENQNPTPEGTSMYRRHMSTGFFLTHWPYKSEDTEVHGFADKAMHIYMGTTADPLQIARGGIYGGTLPDIECVLRAYMLALHQTLSDGYMGTEENILAIILKRFPHLFSAFDNNSLGGHGDNCASFTANSMEEQAIMQGQRRAYESMRHAVRSRHTKKTHIQRAA